MDDGFRVMNNDEVEVASSGISVAIIGASETTLWTYWAMRNLREYKLPGDLWLVNPNRPEVYGEKTFPSIDLLPGVPDVAILITNPARTLVAAQELIDKGVAKLICVSDGFRETATDEGRELERKLKEIVDGKAQMIGPNCVGYASFHDNIAMIAEPIPSGLTPGKVSVLSQSGVLTHTALAAFKAEGLGIDEVYSLGNSSSFTFTDAVNHLVQRESTEVITAVIESITDIDKLSAAVSAGVAKGKAFIWLLMGQSSEGKRVAASHTGAIIGDQRVMRAKLDELGVITVSSFDELTRASALFLQVGRPGPRNGVFFLTDSGGASGVAADTAAAYGLPLAEITEETAAILRASVLPGTQVGNPLDTTTHGGPDATRAIWNALGDDPNVGILVAPVGLSWPDDSDERRWHRRAFEAPVEMSRRTGKKLIYSSLMAQETTKFIQRIVDENPQISVNTGFAQTVSALARLYDHSKDKATPTTHQTTISGTVVAESSARDILGHLGYPMVAGFTAGSGAEAVELAPSIPPPWAVKIAVEGLGHKGRVGGVRLGVSNIEALTRACGDISRRAAELAVAPADKVGFMVQQMVFGPEVLVGLVRDNVAGPAVVVGVGGWSAETGTIFATIPLPASTEHITSKLIRSSLPRLIGEPTVLELAQLVGKLGCDFTSGPLAGYDTVELNPVIMAADGPSITDALLVQRSSRSEKVK